MQIDVSLGEVVDKISILRLKQERIRDPAARRHVDAELTALEAAWDCEDRPALQSLPDWAELCAVNAQLWDTEDALRDCEARQDFGELFVQNARAVYRLNDRRASLKRRINESLGSVLLEVKSYNHS